MYTRWMGHDMIDSTESRHVKL